MASRAWCASRVTDSLLDGPNTVSRPGSSVPRSNGNTIHHTHHGRCHGSRRCNEHDLRGRSWGDGPICQRSEPQRM